MHAEVGDWLVVESQVEGLHARRAQIIAVHSSTGEPPYTVRWPDGRESLVFPGPDARVEPADAG